MPFAGYKDFDDCVKKVMANKGWDKERASKYCASIKRRIEGTEMKEKCPEGFEWNPKQNKCVPCPGSKIRSGGKGRSEGYGKGKGPIGIPIGEKTKPMEDSGWEELS